MESFSSSVLVCVLFQKLLSDVELQVGVEDGQAHRFRVNVTAFCPNGSSVFENTKCSSVRPKQTVRNLFNSDTSVFSTGNKDVEVDIELNDKAFLKGAVCSKMNIL